MKLTKEQIMVAEGMIERGVSVRQIARQFGVRESALRYRLKRRQEPHRPDGRAGKPTSLDGYEEVVHTLLERLGDVRLTGEGRPAQAPQVYEILVRGHGFTGSYRSVARHLVRSYGAPPVRALRRVETPPGVQAQHDWFEVTASMAGVVAQLLDQAGILTPSTIHTVIGGSATANVMTNLPPYSPNKLVYSMFSYDHGGPAGALPSRLLQLDSKGVWRDRKLHVDVGAQQWRRAVLLLGQWTFIYGIHGGR